MMPVSTPAICTTFAAMAMVMAMAVGANASAAHQPALPFRLHDGTLSTVQDKGAAQKPVGPLNTIAEVFTALEACWIPPALDQARAGMQITVQLSFKRSGELLGKPRITYETPDASDDERLSYRVAMAQALRRCTPLPFTDALGGALAGRPLTIRFIDNRKLKQAEATHGSEC
jgi:hypothetical protein